MRLPRARSALRAGVGALLVLAGLVAVPASSASAASAGWADLTFEGAGNGWTGTVRQRATGFPEATLTSDSAGGTSVGRQSGASTFLPASTEVGQAYGSSRGRPYLNLRPFTANGSGTPGSSTTTYRFDAPTPASGWTFVLGDVDADQVTVSATGVGGAPVENADLGFRSVFNYCGSGSCAANDDLPHWDGSTATLKGNRGALDTNGASAWFEPRVPLETLTFVFTRRAGFPVYQTWFATQSHTLTGTVDAPAGVREGLTVELFAPDGRKVGEATTDREGRYRFDDLATYEGYRVALVRPSGYTAKDLPLTQTADLRSDAVVDFDLRAIVPVAVSGTIRDPDGTPLAGVTVRLTGPSPEQTAVSGPDGAYVFDTVDNGDGYTLTAVPEDGATASAPRTFSVPVDSETPIRDKDFTITPAPRGTASGTVTFDGDGPAAGVRVRVTDSDGRERDAVTDDEGRWSLDDLAPGRYDAAVVPLDGLDVVGPSTHRFTVPDDGGTVSGLDFALQAPTVPATFTAGGSVTDEAGMPFPDVDVTVTDPGGQPYGAARTGDDGSWQVGDLLPGDGWTATVEPPSGYEAQGGASSTFAVTDTDVGGLDFVLVERAGGSTGSGSSGSSGSSGHGSGTRLAATGGPSLVLLVLGSACAPAGLLLLTGGRVRRSRARRRRSTGRTVD